MKITKHGDCDRDDRDVKGGFLYRVVRDDLYEEVAIKQIIFCGKKLLLPMALNGNRVEVLKEK